MMSLCTTKIRVALLALCVTAFAAAPAPKTARADATDATARAGIDVARDAARSWAPDARLIYVENDDIVSGTGTAGRWGYLFHSPSKGLSRGYSVRDGKVIEAADLGFEFDAPPLPETWMDSGVAIAAADKEAGNSYRKENQGRLSAALLIRGAFDERHPDATTWTLVYTSETAPALFVVVDATRGKVVRKWRG